MRTSKAQVVAAAAALAALVAPPSANAQPVIRVEAEARLELATRRTESGTEVRLALADDQGAPISGAPLSYRIASSSGRPLAERARALTGSDGSIVVELGPLDEQISVDARFDGDDFRTSTSRVELLDTRLKRTELRFLTPESALVDLREPEIAVRVRVRPVAPSTGLRIAISDERGVELGEATTDSQGVAELAVATAKLDVPGTGKLIARLPGDAQHAPARAELPIVRWLPSTTTLALARAGRGVLRVTGRAQAGGRGIAGAAIGLFDGEGAHVATLQSDEDGRFDASLDLEALSVPRHQRELSLEARYDSDAPWLGSSRSARARLRLTGEGGPSPLWLLLAPLVIALTLWWLGRRRAAVDAELHPANIAEAGVALAHSRPRAARPRGLACTVHDARTGRPLRVAQLELTEPSGATRVLSSDGRGQIRVDELVAGRYRLSFSAEGYRALHVELEAPHRGEWLGAQVRLESLRDVAVRAWAPLATQHATKAEQAQSITLREVIQRLMAERGAGPSAGLHDALDRAERAAYQRPAPTEEEVQRIERDASAMLPSHDEGHRAPPRGTR